MMQSTAYQPLAPEPGDPPWLVSRIWDVLRVMRSTILNAIPAEAHLGRGQVVIGYPTWTELTRMFGQLGDPGMISIDALPDVKVVTRFRPQWGQTLPCEPSFSAVVVGEQIAFVATEPPQQPNIRVGITPPQGNTVHVILALNGLLYDAEYTTALYETAITLSRAVAAAIVALGVTGVSASSSGDTVTVSGATIRTVHITAQTEAHKEVARVKRTVKVTLWMSSPEVRYALHEVVSSTLGAIDACWYTLPDGGRVRILPKGERFVDESQESYNLYEAHMLYSVEYGVVQRAIAYQIGAAQLESSINNALHDEHVVVA